MPRTVQCPTCQGERVCRSCLGAGEIQAPTIREKLVHHMIYSRANPAFGGSVAGLALAPLEVEELAEALGITGAELVLPDPEPPDAGPV